MPVALHGVKEETVCDFAPAACTPLPGQRTRTHCWWLVAASGIHHCPCRTQKSDACLEISQETVVSNSEKQLNRSVEQLTPQVKWSSA